MDNHHIRLEELVLQTWTDYVFGPVVNRINSARTRTRLLLVCILLLVLLLPFHILALLVVAIVACFHLPLANADRVIFVFATSILSFYQVPRRVFYIYMAVPAVTGFLQFLRSDSLLCTLLLVNLEMITIGKSNLFSRKFSRLCFSNPYTRTSTITQTIFFPIGHAIPQYTNMKVFKFPNPPDPNFLNREVVVSDCTITIETLEGLSSALEQERSTLRSLRVAAPWGDNIVTFSMEDENLGRFVSYLDHLATNECKPVICIKSPYGGACRALSIVETIEYLNRGLSLVKLERDGDLTNVFLIL